MRAVLAESFERIHRSNLVGMGVLPLQFRLGESADALGITGTETFDIRGLTEVPHPGQEVGVEAHRDDGSTLGFRAIVRIDVPVEVEYYRNGGVLPMVARQTLRAAGRVR